MHVTICHQAIGDGASADEADVMLQVRAVETGLLALGMQTSVLPCGLDLSQIARVLQASPPDVVFNLVECLDSHGELIAVVPSLLDALAIPYTGACAEALFLTSNKLLARQRMRELGLPVAAAAEASADGMFIVKSVWEHASRGLDADSVVPCSAVDAEIDRRERIYGGRFFAEEYVDGREFNVSMLGALGAPRALDVAEIVFEGYPEAAPKIIDYAAKWDTGSDQYQTTNRRFMHDNERALAERLQDLAVRCWYGFELDGYARIDVRMAGDQVVIVDVNANPCLTPDAGFRAALDRADIAFERALEQIVQSAVARRNRRAAPRRRESGAFDGSIGHSPKTKDAPCS